jgi:uncharacterized protein YkwD
MTTTANIRRLLMSTMRFLPAVIIASSLFFQIGPASADCQVSSTALEVAEITNQERAKYGLRPLESDCQLYKAAQDHTVDMVSMGEISHTGSDGSSVGIRVEGVGYQYSTVGENVAQGQKTPLQVVNAWVNSTGHRENILNPDFTDIGVGYSNNYWTQVFGRRRHSKSGDIISGTIQNLEDNTLLEEVRITKTGSWNSANLTWYTSWPDPNSDECVEFNGCEWAGYFYGVDGQQTEEWVATHNIAAVHEKDWDTYGLKTLRLRSGNSEIDVVVYDVCSDSDCNGCCTQNAGMNGLDFLIDIESYTKDRFGVTGGVIEWMCLDCD